MSKSRTVPTNERLAARLDELGLSQRDLSLRIHVSPAAISRWLSGERTPSLGMAFLLEREVGIPASSWPHARTGTDG